jgi:hypothetical protein
MMQQQFEHGTAAELSRADLDAVISSLEPDQLIFEKTKHHCPRRTLSPLEMLLFWTLRLYLVFMFGVVIYQAWSGAR